MLLCLYHCRNRDANKLYSILRIIFNVVSGPFNYYETSQYYVLRELSNSCTSLRLRPNKKEQNMNEH